MQDSRKSFLVKLLPRASKRLNGDEVGRMIEYLGGRRRGDGFAFESAVRRDEVMQVLKRQFGGGYFAAVDVAAANEPDAN